jgi:hypothetical protein
LHENRLAGRLLGSTGRFFPFPNQKEDHMNQIFPATSRWTRLCLLACLAALLVMPLTAGADLEKGRQISYDIHKKKRA